MRMEEAMVRNFEIREDSKYRVWLAQTVLRSRNVTQMNEETPNLFQTLNIPGVRKKGVYGAKLASALPQPDSHPTHTPASSHTGGAARGVDAVISPEEKSTLNLELPLIHAWKNEWV